MGKAVVGSRDPQRMQVGETFEHGAHGIARAFSDFGRRWNGRRRPLPQQGEIGFDDELLCPLAAQTAAIDPGGVENGGG